MVLTPFRYFFETIDPSIFIPLEMQRHNYSPEPDRSSRHFLHKRSEKFPKLREVGGGKIDNAQKTKDLFLFSALASLMNAGLLHGSVCVIDMYNFLLAEVANPCS